MMSKSTTLNEISNIRLPAALLIVIGLLLPSFTSAQGVLEEVIVTAQKREQSLQDVPVSVSAFTAESLENKGVTNVGQLGDFSPNVKLDFTAAISGSSQALTAFVRGIGQGDWALNTEPGVGVYVDGVYYARAVGSLVDLMDLERVEVLKGPQGTLFGRNTIGGAINVVTKKPGEFFGFSGQVTTGRFNRVDVKGHVDVPLIEDTLYSSFAFSSKTRDGYSKRIPFPGPGGSDSVVLSRTRAAEVPDSEMGNEDNQTFRGKLLWRANDKVEALLTLDYARARESTPASTLLDTYGGGLADLYNACIFGVVPPPFAVTPAPEPPVTIPRGFAAACGPLFGANVDADPNNDLTPYDDRFITGDLDTNYAAGPNISNIDSYGIALNVDWEINDNLTLKSITAYRDLDAEFGRDGDSAPILIDHTSFPYKHEQFSQELQLNGLSFDGKLNWLLGFYYFEEDGDQTDLVPLGGGLLDLDAPFNVSNTSYAAFAHLNYQFTEQLSFTVGMRATKEEKELFSGQTDLNALAFRLGVPLFLHPVPANPTIVAPNVVNEESFFNISPKFGIEYRWNEHFFTYASYSKGFKSGGWSTRLTNPLLVLPSFDEEEATTYEIGFKSDWFDRCLRLNGAGYFTDYENLQVVVQQGISPFLENAAQAEVSGFELEFQAYPTESLLITGGIGYTDEKYTELDPTTILAAVGATELQKTPEWSTNVSADYTVPLQNGGEVVLHVDHIYSDEVFHNAENSPLLRQEAYHLVNLAATYRHPGGHWEISAGGTNVTDERYIVSGFNQPGVGFTEATFSRPSEWYLTFRYNH